MKATLIWKDGRRTSTEDASSLTYEHLDADNETITRFHIAEVVDDVPHYEEHSSRCCRSELAAARAAIISRRFSLEDFCQ